MAATMPGKSWEYMMFVTKVESSGIINPVGLALAKWKGWRGVNDDSGRDAGLALLLSIFWEESLFNNIPQTGAGSAVGFGQVEPAEMYKFDAANVNSPDPSLREAVKSAETHNYLVYHLPKRTKVGNQTRLAAPLGDITAATVSAATLRHVYESKSRNIQTALDAYAGVGFKGQTPKHLATDKDRRAIIEDWLACAKDLFEKGLVVDKPAADPVLDALNKSRPFSDIRAAVKPILFPGQ